MLLGMMTTPTETNQSDALDSSLPSRTQLVHHDSADLLPAGIRGHHTHTACASPLPRPATSRSSSPSLHSGTSSPQRAASKRLFAPKSVIAEMVQSGNSYTSHVDLTLREQAEALAQSRALEGELAEAHKIIRALRVSEAVFRSELLASEAINGRQAAEMNNLANQNTQLRERGRSLQERCEKLHQGLSKANHAQRAATEHHTRAAAHASSSLERLSILQKQQRHERVSPCTSSYWHACTSSYWHACTSSYWHACIGLIGACAWCVVKVSARQVPGELSPRPRPSPLTLHSPSP